MGDDPKHTPVQNQGNLVGQQDLEEFSTEQNMEYGFKLEMTSVTGTKNVNKIDMKIQLTLPGGAKVPRNLSYSPPAGKCSLPKNRSIYKNTR